MSRYTFEDFDFDTQSYVLTQKGAPVTVRPKAARLLAVLLSNQHRVLSKADLIDAIWGSHQVPEYALHQLVSEVRKLAKDKALIRTQPNQGYCWIAATHCMENEIPLAQSKPTSRRAMQMTAGAITMVACLVLVFGFGFSTVDKSGRGSFSLPGTRALAKGIVAMEQNKQDEAVAWFEFVLAENPQANEARLLLAESLLLQSRLEEAASYLYPMLSAPDERHLEASDYEKLAAAELLSRIHQHGGQYFEALQFARQSFFESRAQCTDEYLSDRVRELASLTNRQGKDAVLPEKPQFSPLDSPQVPDYQKYCQRLKIPSARDEASIRWSSPISQSLWAVRFTAARFATHARVNGDVYS